MVTRRGRMAALALVVASVVLIGLMTLFPTQAVGVTPPFCIVCGVLGGVDFALNTILFVPLGMGLQWFTGRWKIAAVAGLAATVTVELLQWQVVSGRDASIGDVLANTIGTVLGAWLAVQVFAWLFANQQSARRYAAVSATLATVTFAASAWLLQPVQPKGFQWVQWTPVRTNMDVFRGRLVQAELNGAAIPSATTVRPERTFGQSYGQSLRVLVRRPVPSSRRQAIMIRGANDVEEAFFLAQRGQSVVYRSHIAASRLKLRSILIRHATALSMTPETSDAEGDVLIEAWSRPSEIGIRVLGKDLVTVPRTVGLAWALFLPSDFALDRALLFVNAVWLSALVLPVSFFSLRSGSRGPERTMVASTWWPVAATIAALAVTPIVGLHHLGVGEWAGVLAGLGIGVVLERVTRPSGIVMDSKSFPVFQDRFA